MKIVKILTTFGGPCVYRQGILEDGSKTGKIQDIGQSKEDMERQLLESIETGRDDVKSFVNGIL